MLRIREVKETDIGLVAENMREADRKEIWDSNLHNPLSALHIGINNHGDAWTALVDDEPVAIFGITKPVLLSRFGVPWLLGTDRLIENKKDFLKTSKDFFEVMKQGFWKLENYISVENVASIIWLRKLGFSFGETIKSITGVSFRRFYMEVG